MVMIDYEKHLKDDAYYNDLYDRQTVESCLRFERTAFQYEGAEKLSQDVKNRILRLSLYFKTGDRYKCKQEIIQKWKEQDKTYDQQYENAVEPQDVRCKFCKEPMKLFDKRLNIGIRKELTLVQFSYRCKECRVGRYFYDNGKIEDRIPWKCPACSRRIKVQHKRKANKIYTKEICNYCNYKQEDILDLSKRSEPKKKLTKEEMIQFEKDRDRFCLSDEKGREYMKSIERIQSLSVLSKGIKNKKKVDAENPKVKDLTIPQLETMLRKELVKNGFAKLSFSEPRMAREVDIDFRVYDKTDRSEDDSRKKLKKLLKILFKHTNWKLMSDGVHYRLGTVTGRLKALERESLSMVNSEDKKNIY